MTGPDLKKLNASDYAAVRNNTIVVAPNNQAIGFANAGMLCTQVCRGSGVIASVALGAGVLWDKVRRYDIVYQGVRLAS